MGTKTKEFSSPHNELTYSYVREKSWMMVWILLTIHVLLAKSEKPVVWRRWLSSYDKSILRTLEVFDVFFIRNLERNSRKLFL